MEFHALARGQDRALRPRRPRIDLLAGGIARGKAQARHLERLLRLADDLAVDQQDGDAFIGLAADAHVLEIELAQVDRQADRGEQRRRLRKITYDLVARADDRDVEGEQHQHHRGPARRPARLLPLALQLAPPRNEAFGLGRVGLRPGGRLGDRHVVDRRHQRRRIVEDRRRLGRGGDDRLGGGVHMLEGLGGGLRLPAEIVVIGHRSQRRARSRGLRRRLFGLRLCDDPVDEGVDRVLGPRRAGEPGRPAACAPDHASLCPDRRSVDLVGRGATRTNDQHGIRDKDCLGHNPTSRPLMDRKPWGGGWPLVRKAQIRVAGRS